MPAIIILAAGQGTRMKCSTPKVLVDIGGKPFLFHILDRILETTPKSPIAIVVGYKKEQVQEKILLHDRYSTLNIQFIEQKKQLGTGDAARVAMESEWGSSVYNRKETVLVLPGDLPLISNELLKIMTESLSRRTALRLLTCELSDPRGYGRVVRRGKKGDVLKIVEDKDATERQKEIQEVNSSIYLFDSAFLKASLGSISNKNAQKEYYLPDLISKALRLKKKIDVLKWHSPEDVRGINDAWELSIARKILNLRHLRKWSAFGVRFIDPDSTFIDASVEFGSDIVVHSGVVLCGTTQIGSGAIIDPRVILRDVIVGEGVHIKAGTIAEKAIIGNNCKVGPYAHLRPGVVLDSDVKIGNFVELKESQIGSQTSISHLSYLGDAVVGKRVNIGCGFVTCNFDGRIIDGKRKHKTVIEDDVFMGSDCQAIAPITISKGAYIASGSTLNKDIPENAFAIARAKQENKLNVASRFRKIEEN